MDDLISRAAAIGCLGNSPEQMCMPWSEVERMLRELPAVDAAPVVHGRWEGYNSDCTDWQRNDGNPIFISCCVCHNVVLNKGSASWNYCPNCGAKMRENE